MKKLALTSVAMLSILASCQKSAVAPVSQDKHLKSSTLQNANASTTQNTQQDMDLTGGMVVSSCSPDLLKITRGTVHIDVRETINGNHFSYTSHQNSQGLTFVDQTTGVKYVGSLKNDLVENGSFNNGSFVATESEAIVANTAGGKNNTIIKFDLHETLNADGTMTAYIDNYRSVCQ
ncbi:MAG: hypothetical protein JSU01_19120 [Bacteroidetes bacterium]|nr:hypothetical protein [Bacteroidota bacterium]